jgi:hypothetical protein
VIVLPLCFLESLSSSSNSDSELDSSLGFYIGSLELLLLALPAGVAGAAVADGFFLGLMRVALIILRLWFLPFFLLL